jgi:predicted enzyme related to lactoylglutathione lyase
MAAAAPSDPLVHPTLKEHTMSTTLFGLAFDVADAADLAAFWASTTGGTVLGGATRDHAFVSGGDFPRLAFHRVPEGKTAKNRLHLDLVASDYEAELDRLVRLGATKIGEQAPGAARWTTMADPEGNEFDVIAG